MFRVGGEGGHLHSPRNSVNVRGGARRAAGVRGGGAVGWPRGGQGRRQRARGAGGRRARGRRRRAGGAGAPGWGGRGGAGGDRGRRRSRRRRTRSRNSRRAWRSSPRAQCPVPYGAGPRCSVSYPTSAISARNPSRMRSESCTQRPSKLSPCCLRTPDSPHTPSPPPPCLLNPLPITMGAAAASFPAFHV